MSRERSSTNDPAVRQMHECEKASDRPSEKATGLVTDNVLTPTQQQNYERQSEVRVSVLTD